MNENALRRLAALGQSVWLDDLSRKLLTTGELQRLIAQDAVSGVTTNPTIFEKAISGATDYDGEIAALAAQGQSARAIYRAITLRDVGDAAQLLLPLYRASGARTGFVSVEVAPELAYQARATVAEARSLWHELGQPNVMIKVPATQAGVEAIVELIADGINVNATLLFSVERYRQVAHAYLAGLRRRLSAGNALTAVASVASFFVSRIDTQVDADLQRAPDERCARLLGQAAIGSAKLAYQAYLEIFAGQEWAQLQRVGAPGQQLLWASTGTKNPAYSPVKYIEALIGADTITTMPRETMDAYRKQGDPASRIAQSLQDGRQTIGALSHCGIDIEQVAQRLELEGVEKFSASYSQGLTAIENKRRSVQAQGA